MVAPLRGLGALCIVRLNAKACSMKLIFQTLTSDIPLNRTQVGMLPENYSYLWNKKQLSKQIIILGSLMLLLLFLLLNKIQNVPA